MSEQMRQRLTWYPHMAGLVILGALTVGTGCDGAISLSGGEGLYSSPATVSGPGGVTGPGGVSGSEEVGGGANPLEKVTDPEVSTVPRYEPPGARVVTASEFRQMVQDLLGEGVTITGTTLTDPTPEEGGFATVGARNLENAELKSYVERFQSAALEAADVAVEGQRRGGDQWEDWLGCDVTEARGTCLEEALRGLMHRAWRRAPEPEELDRYVALADAVSEQFEGDRAEGLQIAVAGILTSPHTLYVVEQGEGPVDEDGSRPLTGHEMAQRLALFLWGSLPDPALLEAAEAGELDVEEGVRRHARRMLQAPAARRHLLALLGEHFGSSTVHRLTKDEALYPEMTPALAASMQREMELMIEEYLLERGDLAGLIAGRETFVDTALADLYGLPRPQGEGFHLVEHPVDGPRRGLLGTAGWLASRAKRTRPSAVLRGAYIVQGLLCEPLGEVPDGVSSLEEQAEAAPRARTMRELLAENSKESECAVCHIRMDPLGLPLENFDAMGRYREREPVEWPRGSGTFQELEIDASGSLRGTSFEGLTGLADALVAEDDLARCLVQQIYRFAVARERVRSHGELEAVIDGFLEGSNLYDMLEDLTASPAFRRVTVVTDEGSK